MTPADVEAAILAGGKGSRFWPFTDLVPKPLIPIGFCEKPILEYIVSWLGKSSLKRIVLLVGYRNRQIRNFFGDGSRWGVVVRYSYDDPYDPNSNDKENTTGYSGTGGALLKAVNNGVLNGNSILVWYGDIIADIDVKKLLRVHRDSKATATLVLARNYQVPVGVPVLNGDIIIELREKPWLEMNPTIGVLVLEREAIVNVENVLGRSFDIMGDLIPYLINNGRLVKGFIHGGAWYDVGSIERHQKMPKNIQLILNRMADC